MPLIAITVFTFGCSGRSFVLTDDAASTRLMSTHHIADLAKRVHPTRVMCRLDYSEPGALYYYVGESHDTHTARLETCRVTADGRVWVERGTMDEPAWELVE